MWNLISKSDRPKLKAKRFIFILNYFILIIISIKNKLLILSYSDQSLISEVLNELELCKSEEIYYEYYKTSDSDQKLDLISKHSQIKEIGEIKILKVKAKTWKFLVVNSI